MRLALRDVHRTYPTREGDVPVLRGVDLDVAAGDYVVIEGVSGAGKTTLLNVAGLLDAPTSGRVLLDGDDAARLAPAAKARLRLTRIGFVFQHHYLVPDLTVLENVALPAHAAGAPADEVDARARDLLDRVGLGHVAARLPAVLSGGEKQRVGVARALVNAPRLLLADEPTGNLDAGSAAAVARLLSDVHGGDVAILLVTHEPDVFPEATRRVVLRDGVVHEAAVTRVP